MDSELEVYQELPVSVSGTREQGLTSNNKVDVQHTQRILSFSILRKENITVVMKIVVLGDY